MYKRRFLIDHRILTNCICADVLVYEEQEYVIRIDFSPCCVEKMLITRLSAFSGSYKGVQTCDTYIS
jgi:hypothetical protein